MAHSILKTGYAQLVERLNRFPQGAPPSETLYAILKMLFSEREAGLVALLPIKPFSAEEAARAWKTDLAEARNVLDELAGRAILLDTVRPDGAITYVLPPPMAGFFEFSLMRLRGDLDQKALAALYYQYITVEDEFMRALLIGGETQVGRAFVHETAVPPEYSLQVLDYERASEVIRTASHRGVGMCYCRHKMKHVDRACDAPLDICMTFNGAADSLVRHGYARQVDVAEGLDLLQRARDLHLVQFGENVGQGVSFICNCCGCCCEAMIGARRFAFLHPVNTTRFLPAIQESLCNGCGKCVNACPVEAMALVSANDPHNRYRRVARLEAEICLGCGVCAGVCPKEGIRLGRQAERVITPVNGAQRVVMMAIERGKLQDLVFDNQALTSHRAMGAILGVILKLPPLKQALASQQLKSRYLERIITWGEHAAVPR